ncbi:hypothetical protein BC826DRAFT_1100432 [Russula brevipes]|nr:hypothetical protein BC826DRAFT_1100432 [Russula brevipes]
MYIPWRLEVNHRPAFMIAIPGSDVAPNVHNMRGLQYTQEILLLFPPFKINLVQLRSLYSILFPKCGPTRLNVWGRHVLRPSWISLGRQSGLGHGFETGRHEEIPDIRLHLGSACTDILASAFSVLAFVFTFCPYKSSRDGPWDCIDFDNMTPATGTIALNNYLQKKGKLSSLSWYDASSGPAHEPEWTSDCKIDGKVIASGKGTHKHISRDIAADQTLAILMSEDSE